MNGIIEDKMHDNRKIIHVEVLQSEQSNLGSQRLLLLAQQVLDNIPEIYDNVLLDDFSDENVKKHIKSIYICDFSNNEQKGFLLRDCIVHYHIYNLNSDEPGTHDLDVKSDSEDLEASIHWILPNIQFVGLWENLIFDSDIQTQLLNYVSVALLYSEKNINPNVVSWNKVILLHGPPGTGKTSLCKALAQKLSIRLSHKYTYGQLIEINSHSLFSKWFSESGKLVSKMFQGIRKLIDDPSALIIVLIDEVESLAHSRQLSLGSTDPSDSLRVVNALLTQLDHIRKYPNVLIFTTSNMTEAIDFALIDRADLKQYIGLPSKEAIYQILHTCICELQKTGVIYTRESVFSLKKLLVSGDCQDSIVQFSLILKEISGKCVGLSGRTLRKLPFIAHSLFIKGETVPLNVFLNALSQAVDYQFEQQQKLNVGFS